MAETDNPETLLDIHRIGGGGLDNLRLKPKERTLDQPGISVLKAPTPADAARKIREMLPKAKGLHEAAKTIGSTSEPLIRSAGFDIIYARSHLFPNHYRIIHPEGADGFNETNLAKLSQVFYRFNG